MVAKLLLLLAQQPSFSYSRRVGGPPQTCARDITSSSFRIGDGTLTKSQNGKVRSRFFSRKKKHLFTPRTSFMHDSDDDVFKRRWPRTLYVFLEPSSQKRKDKPLEDNISPIYLQNQSPDRCTSREGKKKENTKSSTITWFF